MIDTYRYLGEETGLINGEMCLRNWGVLWLECLQAFVDFQQHTGFPVGGPSFPPSTGVWPLEIAVWMKNGRRWKDVELDDTKRFGQRWWEWWHSLQPKSQILRYQKPLSFTEFTHSGNGLEKPLETREEWIFACHDIACMVGERVEPRWELVGSNCRRYGGDDLHAKCIWRERGYQNFKGRSAWWVKHC